MTAASIVLPARTARALLYAVKAVVSPLASRYCRYRSTMSAMSRPSNVIKSAKRSSLHRRCHTAWISPDRSIAPRSAVAAAVSNEMASPIPRAFMYSAARPWEYLGLRKSTRIGDSTSRGSRDPSSTSTVGDMRRLSLPGSFPQSVQALCRRAPRRREDLTRRADTPVASGITFTAIPSLRAISPMSLSHRLILVGSRFSSDSGFSGPGAKTVTWSGRSVRITLAT